MNPIVNAGPDSVIGHAAPSDLKVQPGQLVHFDFGIKQDGFCSDIQRMWYVLGEGETEPPDDVKRIWKIVRGALMAGAMALKPGVAGWEVDAVAREYLVRHGIPEYLHAYGHNVGRVAHDGGVTLGPTWDRYGQSPYALVEEGCVFAIELGAQVLGKGWIYLEENVLVLEDGVEFLSGPQTELMIIKP
jgi:Xaa-Pro aminopeptidase